MRVRKLNLKNYRIHQDSTLDCGDASFVILRGRNFSGKTSFAEALSMNLAQTTVSLDGQGKGFTDKIAQGQSKAIITAEIQGTHLLRNMVTLNTNTSGRTSNVECLDDPDNNKIVNGFSNFLKDRKEAILIATNTDFYSKLDQKSQTNLLAKLVLPAHYDFPAEKIEATNSLLDTPINFDGEPFDVITAAYKATYKQREIVNRQVKEFTIPDALPIPKGVDSESLQTQLTGIREERTKLQHDRDAAVAKTNEVEVTRGRLQTKIEGLRADLDRGKKKLVQLESSILGEEEIKALTHVAAKADELEKLKSDHAGILGAIRTVKQQIDRLKDISEKGATCPTCDQDIDAGKIATLIVELQKESVNADARIQEVDTQIEAIGNVQDAIDTLKSHNNAVKEKAELEVSLTKTVKEGKTTKAELEALGNKVDATEPFTQPLADLQAQEDKVNEQLHPVIAAEERAKEITRLTEQLKKLQAKAATLDSLVKFFDKDGVKKKLIEAHIGSFEAKLREVMSAWGYECSLSEDLRFEVKTARGYVGPVKEISGAEEHIFKVAFQCAVSIAAGIKMVVIDEVEELGSDIRNNLYQVIFSLIQEGKLEQAIMIGYSLDKTLPNPQAPGSRYFYVEEGSVIQLQ